MDMGKGANEPGTPAGAPSQAAGGKPRLLFVSNLFPDLAQPVRGQDNAILLGHLMQYYQCSALVPRPSVAWWRRSTLQPLERDAGLNLVYIPVPYIPKIGDRWNHRLMGWRLRPRLENAAASGACDRLLVSWMFPDGCAVSRWSAPRAIPTTLIAQGSDVHQYLQRPLRRTAIMRAVRDCGSVITRSGALRSMLIDAGAAADAVECIYNGIDTSVFRPADRAQARTALGLAQRAPLLVFVGNLLPVKNPALLLEAFAVWRQQTCHSEGGGSEPPLLAIIGSGPLEGGLRDRAQALGIAGQIRWLGRLQSAEVARWMQAGDALVMTSHNEGLPNVVLEAMACGLPVVSTRVGGIGELVEPPHAGRLVTPGPDVLPGMVEALDDVIHRQTVDRTRLAEQGRRRDWPTAASAYRKHIECRVVKPLLAVDSVPTAGCSP